MQQCPLGAPPPDFVISTAAKFVISTGAQRKFVISTGAQRSGEICGTPGRRASPKRWQTTVRFGTKSAGQRRRAHGEDLCSTSRLTADLSTTLRSGRDDKFSLRCGRFAALRSIRCAPVDSLRSGRFAALRSIRCAPVDSLRSGRFAALRSIRCAAVDSLRCGRFAALRSRGQISTAVERTTLRCGRLTRFWRSAPGRSGRL